MDHGSGHDMGGMDMGGMMTPPPSPSSSSSSSFTNMTMPRKHKMMMHMSFYWGNNADILFTGWPGSSTGMYILSLFVVFLLAFLVECLSRSRLVTKNDVVSGVLLTLLHALRVGLSYMVMLAVMSFNVGVFIVAVVGHALGFLLFRSRVFGSGRTGLDGEGRGNKPSELPPMSSC